MSALDSIHHDFKIIHELTNLLVKLLRYELYITLTIIILIIEFFFLFLLLYSKTYLLTRNDLEIDWRILIGVIERTYYSSYHKHKILYIKSELISDLMTLVRHAKIYFTKQSTSEILNEWKQYLCCYSFKFTKYLYYFSSFLPTLLYPHEHEFGFKLWFEDFMHLYYTTKCESANNLINLFSQLAKDVNG